MNELRALTYAVSDRIARITLNRPERGNGITRQLVTELEQCVEPADLDPDVHVTLLSGNGKGFCGGYDLVESAEGQASLGEPDVAAPPGSPLDPLVMAANHDPGRPWDPMVDYAMMSRNVRGFMSLFHCGKPVVCKVHGFCVAGGTDMALCSDLLLIAADAKIGYPPARVWGSPTTSMWSFRLDERTEVLLARIARMPLDQLQMMKLLVNQSLYAQGLHGTQLLGTVFDGITRHTSEGHAFQQRAAAAGFRQAVRERDEPFGDAGASTFKG